MEPDAKYVAIGAAIVVSSCLIVFAALWINSTGIAGETSHYAIYFKNHTLDGLQRDGDVTMRGIKVGSVSELNIDEKRIDQVKVIVRVRETTPVQLGTKAIIKRNLLTGIARVELVPGKQGAAAIAQVPKGESHPLIPEGRTELDKIADSIPALVERVGELVGRVEGMLSEKNADSLRNILSNVETFSDILAKNSDEITETLESIHKSSERLAKLSGALEKFASKGNKDFENVTKSVVEATEQIRVSVEALEAKIGGAAESLSGSSEVISQQLLLLTQNLSQAASRIAAAMEGFENPRAIITGPSSESLGPGE